MPYKIERVKNEYYVVTSDGPNKGHRHSKEPLSLQTAKNQIKAIYANTRHATHSNRRYKNLYLYGGILGGGLIGGLVGGKGLIGGNGLGLGYNSKSVSLDIIGYISKAPVEKQKQFWTGFLNFSGFPHLISFGLYNGEFTNKKAVEDLLVFYQAIESEPKTLALVDKAILDGFNNTYYNKELSVSQILENHHDFIDPKDYYKTPWWFHKLKRTMGVQ